MGGNQTPIHCSCEQLINMDISFARVWSIQSEVFEMTYSGHQPNPQQVCKAKHDRILCLGIAAHFVGLHFRLVGEQAIENVYRLPDVIWRGNLSHLCLIRPLAFPLPHREKTLCRKVLLPVAAIGEIPHSVDNLAPLLYYPLITSPSGIEKVDR